MVWNPALFFMGGSSVFEWLCCVCSQTRLGPGPRQQGRQVQEEGFPTLGTERSAEWRGRSAAEVCTSEARKIGVPLVARQGRSPSAGLVSLHQRETQRLLCQRFSGQAMRAGTRGAEVDGAETFVNTGRHLIQLEIKHGKSRGWKSLLAVN
jgi:hypothetical protein